MLDSIFLHSLQYVPAICIYLGDDVELQISIKGSGTRSNEEVALGQTYELGPEPG